MKKGIAIMLISILILSGCGIRRKEDNRQDNQQDKTQPQVQGYRFREVAGKLTKVFVEDEAIEFMMLEEDTIIYLENGALYYINDPINGEPVKIFDLPDYHFIISAGKDYAVYENEAHEVIIRWKDKIYKIDALEITHGLTKVEIDTESGFADYITFRDDRYKIVQLDLENGSERVLIDNSNRNFLMDFYVSKNRKTLAYINYRFAEDINLEDQYIWIYGQYEDGLFVRDMNSGDVKEIELKEKEGIPMAQLRLWDIDWISENRTLISLMDTNVLYNVTYIYDGDMDKFTRLAVNDQDLWVFYVSEDGKSIIALEGDLSGEWLPEHVYNLWYYDIEKDQYTQLTRGETNQLQQDRRPILNEENGLVIFERWKGYVVDKQGQYQERIDLMITDLKGKVTTLVEGFVSLNIIGWIDRDTVLIVGSKENIEDHGFYLVKIEGR